MMPLDGAQARPGGRFGLYSGTFRGRDCWMADDEFEEEEEEEPSEPDDID